ncbi:capsule assembly Wzi family protein [Hahella ganghwensis]|uniref:capsule assembly Wzi family protein n=1 Tax=Hahella ganghwensis TaxID=286420 RepID=UPI0012F996DE|nr:capsule assembly Wzi family protein [Hahella ganghwensis]
MKGLLNFILIALTLSGSGVCKAAPWTGIDDVRLRQSLQLLVDSGYLNLNVTAWPINWASIQREILKTPRDQILHPSAKVAFDYVSFELSRNKSKSLKAEAGFRAANEAPLLKSYGDIYTENNELWGRLDTMGDYWALGITARAVEGDYNDSPVGRLDGSYIAGLWGNWMFGIGAIDRWWGAGWQSSLILSTNARPVPGFFIKRNNDFAPSSDWLSWIGPWSLELFAGQLENDRYVPDAKLLGARFSFRPWQPLEIGATRVAQWGGEGRPQSASSLFDLIRGNDNRGDSGITEENEPGNQLAGFDLRYSMSFFNIPGAAYVQVIGEDEAGGMPSRRIWLFGMETYFDVGANNIHQFIEFSDTKSGRLLGSNEFADYAYNHGIYRSGYRYEGRAIGAAIDNDSQILTLGISITTSENSVIESAVSHLKLNDDAGTGSVARKAEFEARNLYAFSMGFQSEWSHLRYKADLIVFSRKLANDYATSGDFAISLEGSYRF